jgi:AAA ATPase domain
MLRSLKIENFRCFQTFELQQLGRLNLLVGTNNSGKTSILEAIQLLNSKSNLESLRDVMISRGEYVLSDERSSSGELDIRHLFYGHEIDFGSIFSILGDSHNDGSGIIVSIQDSEQLSLFENSLRDFVLAITWIGLENEHVKISLSPREGLLVDDIRRARL